jgi:hypothetical protein
MLCRNPNLHFDADPDLNQYQERQQNDADPHAEMRILRPVLLMLENRNFFILPTFTAMPLDSPSRSTS